jgi:hypothetical protein
MKPTRPVLGIIDPGARNRRSGLDSDRAQLFNTRFHSQAQVAQLGRKQNSEQNSGTHALRLLRVPDQDERQSLRIVF